MCRAIAVAGSAIPSWGDEVGEGGDKRAGPPPFTLTTPIPVFTPMFPLISYWRLDQPIVLRIWVGNPERLPNTYMAAGHTL